MGIDETKKLKVSAAAADVKALCGLMVYGNKTINDIKSLGGETILVPICKSGSVKAFKFISSLMKKSEMIQSCYKSMTWIIRNGRVNLLEHILAIPEIRKKSKDGFKQYISDGPQYADIKLNVVIRGGDRSEYNLIGEVQFLLRTMITYKQRAHNLYSIQREKEFMDQSVSKMLPTLMDETQKLKVSAAAADVKALCGLMVYGNKSINDIKNLNGESILVPICKSGSVKAFKFLSSLMKHSEMIESCYKSVRWTIKMGRVNLLEHILAIPEIQKKSKDED